MKTNVPLQQLQLQPDEVDGVFAADIGKMADLIAGRCQNILVSGVYCGENGNHLQERLITMQDMVSHDLDYYIKVFSSLTALYGI